METRKTGRSLLTALCMALFLLTAFAAGAWAGDAAGFIGENYPDNSSVTGGASFTKTWTIKNTGTTTWTSSYKLKYVSGSLSTSQSSVAISGTVAPGGTYTFSVPMKAPAAQSSDKTYREDWKFTNPSGSTINVDYSPTVWALIKVPAAAAGTDSASFTGENYPDNSSVAGGTSFTKTWTIKNTGTNTWNSSYKLKYVSGGGLSVSQADIAISGTVAPGASYTFSVPMKTPAAQSSEKTYRDDWKFYNPSGASIIPLWAVIKVPAAPVAGTDAASLVSETYPDNSSVAGGSSFTKTWTIKNTGTNTWTSSYKLKWVSGGLSVSQADIAISGTVAPGASYTFSVPMKTPAAQSSEKIYRDDWKFCNPSGASIIPLWAVIKVPAASAPSDDHGNDINTATPVNLNSSKAGVINYGGDWDFFRIVMASPGLLTVYTTGSTDTYGYLKNSGGENIKINDDQSSSNKNFLISLRMPSGTYYVAVRHYNSSTGTGSYTFRADFTPSGKTDDHGNRCAEATSVSSKSNTLGMINYAGDVDYFRISVPSGGKLTVSTIGALDSYGRLFDSNCTEIARDNDAGLLYNFKIVKSVSAGTYYVEVKHNQTTGTGVYVLRTDFTLSLPVPTLISPSDGKEDVSASSGATFQWNKSSGATGYRIVISQNSSFSGFDEKNLKCDGTCSTGTTSGTKYVKSSFALSGHTYYWHVRAIGAAGVTSEWSETWEFTTAGTTGNEFPAVNWDSLAYRNNNIFWVSGYAPKRFYSNNISPNLGDAKGNCTWYAHGRLKELGYNAKKLDLMSGNAAKWKSQAISGGISVSQVPMQGDIAQATANYGIYTKYGHVAVVEKVNSDGTLLISESSYAPNSKTWNFEYNTRTVSRGEFNNYIHVPKP